MKQKMKDFPNTSIIIMVCVMLISLPVTALSQDQYEADDTFEQARVIVLSKVSLHHHDFHDADDADWVRFYGLSGIKYSIQTASQGTTCDFVIELYDTDGETLLESQDTTGDLYADELLNDWECPRDGIYYMKIWRYHPNADDTVCDNTEYDLRVWNKIAPFAAPITIRGTVRNAFSNAPLGDVMIKTVEDDTEPRASALSERGDGSYLMFHEPGIYIMRAMAFGFEMFTDLLDIKEDGKREAEIQKDIFLVPKIDINGDDTVDLADAVLGLKIASGMEVSGLIISDYLTSDIDVNGDNKIGLEEVMYIIRKVAGI